MKKMNNKHICMFANCEECGTRINLTALIDRVIKEDRDFIICLLENLEKKIKPIIIKKQIMGNKCIDTKVKGLMGYLIGYEVRVEDVEEFDRLWKALKIKIKGKNGDGGMIRKKIIYCCDCGGIFPKHKEGCNTGDEGFVEQSD